MGKKYLLLGTNIGGNYGCDAIAIGTERILHHSFPDCEVWFPHNSWRNKDYDEILGLQNDVIIKNTSKIARARSLSRRFLEKSQLLKPEVVNLYKNLVKKSDCVLSIGGDLYTFANKEQNWPFPYPIIDAGNKIMRMGKPYVIWCASVGPLEKAGARLGEIVDHLRSCRAIIVREQESYLYLREKVGLDDNLYLAGDPAFVMEPEPFELPFIDQGSTDKILAVNFSLGPMQHVFGHQSPEKFHEKLVSCLQNLLDKLSIRVLLVPHVGNDYKFLHPIFEKLRTRYSNRVHVLPAKIGAKRTKWAVSQANALLTMRFHCALAGFSTNTPTMVLVSTSKGGKICNEMYGDLEYAINISDMNSNALIHKLKDLLDNEEIVRAKLLPVSEKMKERALSAGEVLSRVL